MEGKAYITMNQVEKTIKGRCVLDHISLEIKKGEVLGLRGINGSGKTMILRALAGLIRYQGEILIEGKKWEEVDPAWEIGALIEQPGFLPEFTGKENLQLLEMLREHKTEGEIEKTMEELGLDPDDTRKYGKYSLGMKQKLGIVQAVIYSPDLILLDEPTNALDQDGIDRLKEAVRKRKEQNCTCVIASHDMDFLRETADRIIAIEEGRIADERKEK